MMIKDDLMPARLAARHRPTQQQVMYQTWRDLLFLHWEYPVAEIQHSLPAGLTVDSYQGKAYVGLVPFFMCHIRPRFVPAIPPISNFLEINVRTYVYDANGLPGVWFYSLDTNSWLAVQVARRFFKLPYFYAQMSASEKPDQTISYQSWRRASSAGTTSHFTHQPQGQTHFAQAGSLEFFLAERYILFAHAGNSRLYHGYVHHSPYPLQLVQVSQWNDHLLEMAGLTRPQRPPDHTLFSPGVDVEIFPIKRLPR